MPASLTLLAPAKINLYLAVGGRRSDGYHDVVTVLQSLDTRLSDVVTVTEAESFSVVCEPDIGLPVEDNIATRTISALAGFAGRTPDVAVRIEKQIPAAAGLGGASADAAAVLVGACRLWGIDANTPQVLGLAQSLGADVPFFISGGTAVYGGRGDVLLRRLTTPRFAVVLANADEPVPTPAAYAAFDRLPHPQAPSI
ncbi:MAG: 4-(cytidine 5'-diphospho)-2-C-methyl-D-erythritol kinase, partial [Coriobacteriales bacterium]